MSFAAYPATFRATGSIQSYVVPRTGNYVIAAAGAQGGAGRAPGGKGALVQGQFYLREGDMLSFVVGGQGSPGWSPAFAPAHAACGGGGGGGTFVWKATHLGLIPVWPLLVAGGGGGGGSEEGGEGLGRVLGFSRATAGSNPQDGAGGYTDPCRHFGGGGGAGWYHAGGTGPGPVYCPGGARWAGGEGAVYGVMQGGDGGYGGGGAGGFLGYASGGGAGFDGGAGGGQMEYHLERMSPSTGGSSYNSGLNQTNTPGFQAGDGGVSITRVLATTEPVYLTSARRNAASALGT